MTKIVSLLGRLSSADAEVDNSKAVPNSTRWVFDVDQKAGSFAFNLVAKNGREIRPLVLSFALVPLDPSFYSAKVHFSKSNGSELELSSSGETRYRVTIDTISSLVH